MYLVTGATGLQGGSVAAALLAAGLPVRALVRDPASKAAMGLATRGVELYSGDFDYPPSLIAAMKGVTGVFSMQLPPTNISDPGSEVRQGRALISAAKATGVHSFVHTSVARAGEQKSFIGWKEGRWWSNYWDSKSAVNDSVWNASFPCATILKPAYMMDNFVTPSMVAIAFPKLKLGRIETQLYPDTRLDMISAEDVGKYATSAFREPERFNNMSIDLAAESLTMTEVAAIFHEIKGVPVAATFVSAADALAMGANPAVIQSYEWDNIEGYRVNIRALSALEIGLTSFAEWAFYHRDRILVNRASS